MVCGPWCFLFPNSTGALFCMGKGTKFKQRIGTKQQSPHDNSPFSCFEYLILYKLVTNAFSITYTKRGMWKVCLYTIICIFCCNSFYNHNGPVLCRWQPLLVKRNPLWLQLLFSSKDPALISWSGWTGLLAVACPHVYLPWYSARFTCCSRALRVGGRPSSPLPFPWRTSTFGHHWPGTNTK